MGCSPSKVDALSIQLDAIDVKLNTVLANVGTQADESIATRTGAASSKVATGGGKITRTDGKYDVFVSHGKKLPESEDRAVWVADVCEREGLLPFFDRSDLVEITEPALKKALMASDVCVTVIDPFTFNSVWVFKENLFAANTGIPIVA
eukprot:4983448-Prymnesium_polylepis.1